MATAAVQAQYESIPGNELNAPTLSTKLMTFPLISFTPTLGANPMERNDETRGVNEPLAVVPEIFAPAWAMESRAYPDTCGFLYKLILGAPVTTAGDGIITDPDGGTIPVGAYRHVYTAPFGPTGLNPLTAQFQPSYKDQSVFFKIKGAGCSSLALTNPAQGGCRVAASGPALYITRQADPAYVQTYESLSILPFERPNLTLPTWLASTATHEDFSFTIANQMEAVRTLGIASRFPDDLEYLDPPVLFTGSLPQRVVAAADWDALIANTGFTAKAKWLGTVNIGATSYKYTQWLEMTNCQYVGGDAAPLRNARRLGATFNFSSTNATGTAGGSSKITLVNATASYA
jgi:hypothetical protein